jgi:deoxyribose-phosphate aldolase
MTDPVALLDLTTMEDDDTPEKVRALCEKAQTPRGPVAAVCVLPRLAAVAVEALQDSPVRVATVSNFPDGGYDPAGAAATAAQAIADGVDEVDVVAPWRSVLNGDDEALARLVAATAEACDGRTLKVILETGSHPDAATTRAMADAALAAGAFFLKTSTGKFGPGADLGAARVLLEAVRDNGSGGVKVSGGVRTAAQADDYIRLVAAILGEDAVTPERFRIGASSLLDALLETADVAGKEDAY